MISKDELKRLGAYASTLPVPSNEIVARLVNSHLDAYEAVGEDGMQARNGFVFLRQQINQEAVWLRANKDRFDPEVYREMEARWTMLAKAGMDKGL